MGFRSNLSGFFIGNQLDEAEDSSGDIDLGKWVAQNNAFGVVAGRTTAAQVI